MKNLLNIFFSRFKVLSVTLLLLTIALSPTSCLKDESSQTKDTSGNGRAITMDSPAIALEKSIVLIQANLKPLLPTKNTISHEIFLEESGENIAKTIQDRIISPLTALCTYEIKQPTTAYIQMCQENVLLADLVTNSETFPIISGLKEKFRFLEQLTLTFASFLENHADHQGNITASGNDQEIPFANDNSNARNNSADNTLNTNANPSDFSESAKSYGVNSPDVSITIQAIKEDPNLEINLIEDTAARDLLANRLAEHVKRLVDQLTIPANPSFMQAHWYMQANHQIMEKPLEQDTVNYPTAFLGYLLSGKKGPYIITSGSNMVGLCPQLVQIFATINPQGDNKAFFPAADGPQKLSDFCTPEQLPRIFHRNPSQPLEFSSVQLITAGFYGQNKLGINRSYIILQLYGAAFTDLDALHTLALADADDPFVQSLKQPIFKYYANPQAVYGNDGIDTANQLFYGQLFIDNVQPVDLDILEIEGTDTDEDAFAEDITTTDYQIFAATAPSESFLQGPGFDPTTGHVHGFYFNLSPVEQGGNQDHVFLPSKLVRQHLTRLLTDSSQSPSTEQTGVIADILSQTTHPIPEMNNNSNNDSPASDDNLSSEDNVIKVFPPTKKPINTKIPVPQPVIPPNSSPADTTKPAADGGVKDPDKDINTPVSKPSGSEDGGTKPPPSTVKDSPPTTDDSGKSKQGSTTAGGSDISSEPKKDSKLPTPPNATDTGESKTPNTTSTPKPSQGPAKYGSSDATPSQTNTKSSANPPPKTGNPSGSFPRFVSKAPVKVIPPRDEEGGCSINHKSSPRDPTVGIMMLLGLFALLLKRQTKKDNH